MHSDVMMIPDSSRLEHAIPINLGSFMAISNTVLQFASDFRVSTGKSIARRFVTSFAF